jgi:ectoine hydroxylase-related dioxygenase (phytanoyl-CoA dioxygenase family)
LNSDYERDGFLLVRNLIGPGEIAAICERFESIWREGVPGYLTRDEKGVINSEERYPRIIHPHRFDSLSRSLLLDPRITSVVAELLDDEPVAAQTMFYWKPPGTKGQALHQDNLYLKGNAGEGCMGAWLAVDNCDEENGCLIVVPGSHKLDLQCPGEADGSDSFTGHYVSAPESMREVPLLMNAGDCVFFGGHTIHGSRSNTSPNRMRRSFICHYIGTRCTESASFYNPLIRLNGEEFGNAASQMGSPCGVAFDGPH